MHLVNFRFHRRSPVSVNASPWTDKIREWQVLPMIRAILVKKEVINHHRLKMKARLARDKISFVTSRKP